MSNHAHVIEEVLKAEGLEYTANADKTLFLIPITVPKGNFCTKIQITSRQIRIRTDFPIHIPEDKRDIVMRRITELDYALVLGKYDFDLRDGKLAYTTVLMVDEGDVVAQSIIKHLFMANVAAYSNHQKEILTLASSNLSNKKNISVEQSNTPLYPSQPENASDLHKDKSDATDDEPVLDTMIPDVMDSGEPTGQ